MWVDTPVLMTGILQDIRYALRGLRKHPGYALIAILTLSIGIGANTAMFSVLNALVLRPLPYPSPAQLAMLWTEMPNQQLREGRSAFRDVEQWQRQSKTFEDMSVSDGVSVWLTAPGELERISVVRASPNFFSLLGVQPVRGRVYSNEEADERRRVAVVSYQFWQTRLGGSDAAIGKTIEIDDLPSEVIGILPASFKFPGGAAEVWEPHTMFSDWESRRTETSGSWMVLGRMRPGITVEQGQDELSAIARRLDEGRGASEQKRGVSVVPLSVHAVGSRTRLALWMLTGAVFCVLLIGMTNIASLSLARNAGREREMALRAALGANRGRVLRQLFVESLTLAVLAGIAGVLVALGAIRVIVALKPGNLALDGIGLDGTMLVSTLGLSILTGVLVALAPAITTGRLNLRPALHDGGRAASAGSSARLVRRALVVAEFALAIVLLAGAGLLMRSLLHVQNVDLGFNPERVLSLQLSLPPAQTSVQRAEHYRQVLEQLDALGQVEDAGIVGDLFVSGNAEQVISIEGSPDPLRRLRLRRDEASSGFFTTLRVRLLRGRLFSSGDGPDAPRVAIVNDAMATRLWPGEEPIGRRFKFGAPASNSPWFTVVGLVADMRRQGIEIDPVPQMFEPLAQNPSRLATLLVRTSTDPLSAVGTLRAAISRVDGKAPVYGIATLASRLTDFQAERRFQTSLLAAFSLAALFLAAIGIYGVIQHSIATRTREIGVRMAIGADRRDIFRLMVAEGMTLSLTGVVLGLIGALWLGNLGSSLLFGVAATDVPTYAGVSLLLTAVAAVGCAVPALRAARVDPVIALRAE